MGCSYLSLLKGLSVSAVADATSVVTATVGEMLTKVGTKKILHQLSRISLVEALGGRHSKPIICCLRQYRLEVLMAASYIDA